MLVILLFLRIVRWERDFLTNSFSASPIPNLASLPLHGDAGGIADLDPDGVTGRTDRYPDRLGNDTLGTKPARMGEQESAHLRNFFAEPVEKPTDSKASWCSCTAPHVGAR
jgi:hypothetical protein